MSHQIVVFHFGQGNNGVIDEKMSINPNGNVGIGTTNPAEKLHVNGDIAAKYNGARIYLGHKAGGDWIIYSSPLYKQQCISRL